MLQRNEENINPHALLVRVHNVTAILENFIAVLNKIDNVVTCDSEISSCKQMFKTCGHKMLCLGMFVVQEKSGKEQLTHMMEYYAAIRCNKLFTAS